MKLDGLRDIKPPMYFKTSYLFLLILAVVIILIIIGLLAVFIYKKRRRKKDIPVPVIKKTAYEIAYEALTALRNKNLPAAGKIKEYYIQLSDIIRHYIEDKFSIRAPEMTTEEFLSALKDSDFLSGLHKNLLKEFMTLTDIVKFARYGPRSEEIDNSFNAAKKFIDETK